MSQAYFLDKLVKSGGIPIHFIRCKDIRGRDCYYFLMCSHEKVKILKSVTEGNFNVNDYGKIIASGFGREVSEDIRLMLKSEYGFDIDSLV